MCGSLGHDLSMRPQSNSSSIKPVTSLGALRHASPKVPPISVVDVLTLCPADDGHAAPGTSWLERQIINYKGLPGTQIHGWRLEDRML
jgi:hypothetical protein